MAIITETPNPFEPLTGMKKHVHPGGVTIRGWLEMTYPGFEEFKVPTICIRNGNPILRKDWDQEIKKDDIVNFVAVVGDVATIIIAVIVIIAAIVLALVLRPPTPGVLPASDPVFSVKGQQNEIRLGEPIEVNYGRNRIYPSFASRPFYRYQDNDQFQFSLFCLGQGIYDIEAIQIGDTAIADYQEVTYEVLPPGEQTTLFHTNVYTAVEVNGQTLYMFDEANYPIPDGWVGPFPANPSGTEIFRIELDVTFPKGIFFANKKGKLESITVTFQFERRLIDDAGAPLGDWEPLITPTVVKATTTPQRTTYSIDVDPGRYEVRGRRVTRADIDATHQSELSWEGLRGFVLGDEPDYGDVTLLAVKIRATSNLNANTQKRFNVIATRKLPIRESGGGFSEPVATRSIIWAFVDVFRNSKYGGRITDESFFDWDALEVLDALYEDRNEHFDWTFRDPLTIWEAAKTIARVGRATPMLVGSLITMKRDGPLELPVALFNPDNIVKGTFEWQVKLWEPNEFDSISVEYTDPSTGYLQEQVLTTLPGGTTDNPQDVRIPGIQDRNHAYHEGLYILASDRYLRENISFETGMEGFLPSFGDLIAVAHDVPQWGQSGYILGVEQVGDVYTLSVSEPLIFQDGFTYQILLRGRQAEVIGPITATATDDPKKVTITLDEEVDFLLGGQTEPMLFLFGKTGQITKYGRVVKIEPQGGERIRITMVNDAPVIHSFDSLEAPALVNPSLPPLPPDLPVISDLFLSRLEDPVLTIQASWPAAFGALSYIVQTSEDGENWQLRAETTRPSIQLPVRPGRIYVRVAAINLGQGPWIQRDISVGLVFGLAVATPWTIEWTATWWENVNIDAYLIKIYDNTESTPVLKRTVQQEERGFTYTYDMAVEDDNVVREMLVTVDAMVIQDIITPGPPIADGAPSSQEISNPIPEAPSNLRYEVLGFIGDNVSVRLSWDYPVEDSSLGNELIRVKVWVSDTDGFDPEVVAPIFDYSMPAPDDSAGLPDFYETDIPLESGEIFADHYWRMAVYDVWGNELTSNMTTQRTISLEWILYSSEWEDTGRWIDGEGWRDS